MDAEIENGSILNVNYAQRRQEKSVRHLDFEDVMPPRRN